MQAKRGPRTTSVTTSLAIATTVYCALDQNKASAPVGNVSVLKGGQAQLATVRQQTKLAFLLPVERSVLVTELANVGAADVR